jgi:hypothetical protein
MSHDDRYKTPQRKRVCIVQRKETILSSTANPVALSLIASKVLETTADLREIN